MNQFDRLTKDTLFHLATHLDLPDLISLCIANPKIHNLIRPNIWNYKLRKDFPDIQTPYDIYSTLYRNGIHELNCIFDQSNIEDQSHLNIRIRFEKLPKSINLLKKLKMLKCSENVLEEIPNNLPDSLLELNMAKNYILKIPKQLPKYLRKINLDHNHIEEIPENLPDTIEFLSLVTNDIKKIPKKFPKSLRSLWLGNNFIEMVDYPLPEGLIEFSLSGNPIQKIPDPLPDSLENLWLKRTKINILEYEDFSFKSYPNSTLVLKDYPNLQINLN